MGGRFWQSVSPLAALLVAVGCAPAAAVPGAAAAPAKSPASVTVAAPRATPAASANDELIPDWVRGLLPDLQITSASHVMDLVAAPTIVITQQHILVQG